MPKQGAGDLVLSNIDGKLNRLSPIPDDCCIFKVPDSLRRVNEKAYEPEVVAIGPYHNVRDHNGKPAKLLQPVEEHKLRYMHHLLERRNETSADRYILAMLKLEERARQFYAEPIQLSSVDFVEMMLLDSCFIVELLCKYVMAELIDLDDPIFKFPHILFNIRRDLLLVENQIPLFILMEFFDMTRNSINSDPADNFTEMALQFFKYTIQPYRSHSPMSSTSDDVQKNESSLKDAPPDQLLLEQYHLLGLMHYFWCYPRVLAPTLEGDFQQDELVEEDMYINSSTELQNVGIKFKYCEEIRTLFDIRFTKGTMEIPPLIVSTHTDRVFSQKFNCPRAIPSYPLCKMLH